MDNIPALLFSILFFLSTIVVILVCILQVLQCIMKHVGAKPESILGRSFIIDHSNDPYTEAYEGDPNPDKRINTMRS